MDHLFEIAVYLTVIINPVSKIFILSAFSGTTSYRALRRLSVKSSFYAAAILIIFAVAGNIILHQFFRVDLYSLKVAGGIILFTIGFNALSKGLFFEIKKNEKLGDIAIVPLASPMIAGPGSITACLSFSIEYGLMVTVVGTLVAIGINLMFMLSIRFIHAFLQKSHITGALIRITGLFVATMAVQMVFDGVKLWMESVVR